MCQVYSIEQHNIKSGDVVAYDYYRSEAENEKITDGDECKVGWSYFCMLGKCYADMCYLFKFYVCIIALFDIILVKIVKG